MNDKTTTPYIMARIPDRNTLTPDDGGQRVIIELTLEEHKIIMDHRRYRDAIKYMNALSRIAKRLDPEAWVFPDAWHADGSALEARRDVSLYAAEKELPNRPGYPAPGESEL